MKPEIGHSDMVMASYIGDLLNDIEWNMKRTELRDPYFKQLSVEKFTLETMLQEIALSFVKEADEVGKAVPDCDFVLHDSILYLQDGAVFSGYAAYDLLSE